MTKTFSVSMTTVELNGARGRLSFAANYHDIAEALFALSRLANSVGSDHVEITFVPHSKVMEENDI